MTATGLEFITALFYEVDEQLRAIPNIPRPTSGPVRSSPSGSCMPSKAGATGRFIGGSRATIGPCFPAYRSGHGSFASS